MDVSKRHFFGIGGKTVQQHDLQGRFTAFQAGQEDFINGKPCNPGQFCDAYRQEMYIEGYDQEDKDHSCIVYFEVLRVKNVPLPPNFTAAWKDKPINRGRPRNA
jgi:hypothetical protein